jgi:hypothetical protein
MSAMTQEDFMMKKICFFMLMIMITTVAVYSNSKLAAKHKYLEKDDKKVNCVYCHGGDVKIKKKKNQIINNTLNGVEFSKIKSCAGDDCHGR